MIGMRYLFVFAALLIAAPVTVVAIEPEIVEFIFESAPFASAHASTIVETRSGLVAAWFGGTREGADDVGIWLSRRVSGKWAPPVEVATGVQDDGRRFPTWNPVLFELRAGELALFYKVGPNPRAWWGMVRTSSDDGRTWSDGRRLPDGILGPIKNKPVRLQDGSIIAPSSTESPDSPSAWRVHFERTRDAGKTWSVSRPPAAAAGSAIDAIQPSILTHGGGKLQAIGRTRSGRVFETWSDDSGQTWSPVTLLDLPNPSAGTDALTLKDGRHLLVYNHTPKGRTPLNVAVSRDGRAWDYRARSRKRARRIFVSSGHPDGRRARAHYLHVAARTRQARRARSGEAQELRSPMAEHVKRVQVYETPDVTVTFDPNLCQHTGICLRGLPSVFDIREKRWVRPELAPVDEVIAQVGRCPSGALQIRPPAR